LGVQEVRELIQLAQSGDAEAKERLVEANLRLVMSVARRFLGRGRELEDLFQAGCLGLMHAIEKFDLDVRRRVLHLRGPVDHGGRS